MRTKATFRLPPDLMRRLSDYATRKRVSQAVVVEAALESFLSADGPDRLEAALARRLDRLSRASERLERHVTIGNEALALFVRFWLTNTPPLPDTAQPAAQSKGRARYEAFIETLGRRLAQAQGLADEVASERAADNLTGEDPVLAPSQMTGR
jgi:predicted transcriptional regulator